jgi:hypothetical protein
MSGRAGMPRTGGDARSYGDAGTVKLIARGGPGNAQLSTDLAERPTLGVQVGRMPYPHRATVTSPSRIGFSPKQHLRCQVAGAGVLSLGVLRNHSHISGDS